MLSSWARPTIARQKAFNNQRSLLLHCSLIAEGIGLLLQSLWHWSDDCRFKSQHWPGAFNALKFPIKIANHPLCLCPCVYFFSGMSYLIFVAYRFKCERCNLFSINKGFSSVDPKMVQTNALMPEMLQVGILWLNCRNHHHHRRI